MKTDFTRCHICGGEMAAGRCPDLGENNRPYPSSWVEEDPEEWGDWVRGHVYRVITYACRSCGHLESYLYDKLWPGMNKGPAGKR